MAKTYTTVQGDMWDSVTLKIYGGEQYMKTLLEANEKYMGSVVFPAGLTLSCPNVEKPVSSFLPPWKE